MNDNQYKTPDSWKKFAETHPEWKPVPLSRVDRLARWMLGIAPKLFILLALAAYYIMDDLGTSLFNLGLAIVYQLMSIENRLLDE